MKIWSNTNLESSEKTMIYVYIMCQVNLTKGVVKKDLGGVVKYNL